MWVNFLNCFSEHPSTFSSLDQCLRKVTQLSSPRWKCLGRKAREARARSATPPHPQSALICQRKKRKKLSQKFSKLNAGAAAEKQTDYMEFPGWKKGTYLFLFIAFWINLLFFGCCIGETVDAKKFGDFLRKFFMNENVSDFLFFLFLVCCFGVAVDVARCL